MKYANYYYEPRGKLNIGDSIQILAIDNLYREMSIASEDIVYIDMHKLHTYQGEYVILPVSMPLVDYIEQGIAGRFSSHIIPVFFGLTMVRDVLYPEEVLYLKQYEPVGCRDQRTLETLRRYQIKAYLHGCITITFPLRDPLQNPGHPYIVDVDERFLDFIPKDIRNQALYKTHFYMERQESAIEMASKQYNEYYENASIVITSLLHCAVPCMAAGIPVVIMKNTVSYRFGWIDKLVPVYTPDMMNKIDWNVSVPAELEQHKKIVRSLTINRLRETFEKYKSICDLSWFYENRKKNPYALDACQSLKEFVDTNWSKDVYHEYSVWGVTQVTEWLCDYIDQNYDAHLCHVYDTYKNVTFRGKKTEHPKTITSNTNETFFVTAWGVGESAKELFAKRNIPKERTAFISVVL